MRLQAAFSLGYWRGRLASTSLANLALQHTDDAFLVQAFLSSLNPENIADVVERIVDPSVAPSKSSTLLKRLIPSGIAMGEEETLTKLVDFVCTAKSEDARDANWALVATFVEALEQIRNRGTANASASVLSKLESFLIQGRRISENVEIDESVRLKTIGLLGRRIHDSENDQITLRELLGPKNSTPIQMAAATGLARVAGEQAANTILGLWRSYSPAMKSHVLDLLLARDEWIVVLLDAMESGVVGSADLNAMRRQRLLTHPTADIVSRSEMLLAGKIDADRKNVLDEYRHALRISGNSGRGKELFKKNCGTCHRLGEVGYAVGPDLMAVASKSHEFLLQEILDPNRNLDNHYIAYLART
ncbi:MAG: c-type cytochrome, partial [Pirellula staleyi]